MTLKELLSREMTRKQKVEHIWEYYKIPIIGGIIGIIIIYSFLDIWVFNPAPANALDLMIRTEYYDSDAGELLRKELDPLIVEEGINEAVSFDFLRFDDGTDPNVLMASQAKFVAKIELKEIDLLLLNQETYDEFLKEGMLMDLEEFANEYGVELDDALKIKGTSGLDGEEAVYALDANEIPALSQLVDRIDGEYYFGIIFNTIKEERAAIATEYILSK